MKIRVYALILLCSLVFNLFRFEIPYIQYALFKTYIAKNLCENKDKPHCCCEGKCFREKQIKQVNTTRETDSPTEKNTNKTSQTKEVTEFLFTQKLLSSITSTNINYIIPPSTIIHSRSVGSIFIPPRA